MNFNPIPGTQVPSSTGGVITFTKTGLIHTAGKNFSGKAAQEELVHQGAKKQLDKRR